MSNKEPDPESFIVKIVKGFISKQFYDKAVEQVRIRLSSCTIGEVRDLIRLLWYIEQYKTIAENDVKYPEGDDRYLLHTLEDLVSDLIGKGDVIIPGKIANSQFTGISEAILDEIRLEIEYNKSLNSSYTAEFVELATKITARGAYTFTRTGLIIGTLLFGQERYGDANSYAKSSLQIAKQRNQKENINKLTALEKAISAELKNRKLLNDENKRLMQKKNNDLAKKNKKLNEKKKGKKDNLGMSRSDVRGEVVADLGDDSRMNRADEEGEVTADVGGDSGMSRTDNVDGEEVADDSRMSIADVDESIKIVLEKIRKGKLIVDENDSELDEELELARVSLAHDAKTVKYPKFEGIFKFVMECCSGHNCYIGFVQSNAVRSRKSLIEAQESQIAKWAELCDLCAKHESLVTVQFALMDDESTTFIVSEVVYGIDNFFEKKFKELGVKSKAEYWKSIEETFWLIFRDIVRGLMFLYQRGFGCGDLAFNSFVTEEGRGRLLPSMKTPKKHEDLCQLSQVMKTTITLGLNEDTSFLPSDVVAFFRHIDNYKLAVLECIPFAFFLDHPCTWTLGEKVAFPFKLRGLIKGNWGCKNDMEWELKLQNKYLNWSSALDGVYKEVYDKSLTIQTANTVSKYRQKVDLVRYIVAVFTHVNGPEYKATRAKKKFDDARIEQDLMQFFPHFYTDMFTCLCDSFVRQWSKTGAAPNYDLMEVSSVYHRGAELRRASLNGLRSYVGSTSHSENVIEGTGSGVQGNSSVVGTSSGVQGNSSVVSISHNEKLMEGASSGKEGMKELQKPPQP